MLIAIECKPEKGTNDRGEYERKSLVRHFRRLEIPVVELTPIKPGLRDCLYMSRNDFDELTKMEAANLQLDAEEFLSRGINCVVSGWFPPDARTGRLTALPNARVPDFTAVFETQDLIDVGASGRLIPDFEDWEERTVYTFQLVYEALFRKNSVAYREPRPDSDERGSGRVLRSWGSSARKIESDD